MAERRDHDLVHNGYNIIRNDRKGRGGGVSIIYNNSLNCQKVSVITEKFKQPYSIEYVAKRFQISKKSFTICIVYIPNKKLNKNDIENLEKVVTQLKREEHVYIMGDFNRYYAKSDPYTKQLKKLLQTHEFIQLVTEPTREEAVLDLIITKKV